MTLTCIFLDGSEKALDSTITVFEEFRSLSGLNIIIEKTHFKGYVDSITDQF